MLRQSALTERRSKRGGSEYVIAARPLRANGVEQMGWWRRLMRWLRAYEVQVCPWCGGDVLVRDELPVHMGDACSGWKAKSGVWPIPGA